jgi:hypothetical protein
LDLELGKRIRKEFPQLEVHSSVRYFDNYLKNDKKVNPNDFINHLNDFIGIIDTVNLSGIYSMYDAKIQNRCRELDFKIKYITNEGCIRFREDNYDKFPGLENDRCFNPEIGCGIRCTKKIVKMYPWLGLVRARIYKETLKYIDYDILKISSRGIADLNEIETLISYWTSDYETSFIADIPIYDLDTYQIYLNYIETISKCNGKLCYTCRACEKYYNDIKKSTENYLEREKRNEQIYKKELS